MNKEYFDERIEGLKASVAFYSPQNKTERELWVANAFLRNLGMLIPPNKLIASDMDPPDVVFEDAKFEIKEILDVGRCRHAEYKQELKEVRSSDSTAKAFRSFRPKDIHISQVYELCRTEAEKLVSKYSVGTRRDLDLLFYVNLRHVVDIIAEPFPSVLAIAGYGWRSISFVKGRRSCCFFADHSAPFFLLNVVGRVVSHARLDGDT